MYIVLVAQHVVQKLLELRMFHFTFFKFFLKTKFRLDIRFFTSENAKQAPSLVRVLPRSWTKS